MRIHPGDMLPSAQARPMVGMVKNKPLAAYGSRPMVERKPLWAFARGAPAQTSASRSEREEYG